ncbi:netrin receptor UNC5D-like [Micropterus salmoides]|uniref:netrin receptor UNC5D-like n=1 Tax=Micropterus salmoides TaxID=27706 RepID=UPI0018EB2191|nr:netrin receptor UNC5D-like [Micropterus salmoides]
MMLESTLDGNIKRHIYSTVSSTQSFLSRPKTAFSTCLFLSVCVCVFSVQTLEGCDILLGPEVTYGPPGLDLFCPVAMTIAHCAEVDAENWNIQLKRKTQDSKWEEVMTVEEESTSCYCLMDSTNCHLLLDQPGSYALVGEPLTQAAVKRLKLAVFGSMEAGSVSYILRVYCVDDTPHAFQGVVAAEKTRGGQLLEEPKLLPFRANTFSLQVSIQDVPQFLWSIKPFTTCQVTMAVTDKDTKVLICKILFIFC